MREQLAHGFGVNRFVDPRPNLDVARVEPLLPRVGGRDHSVRADQSAPLHVVAKGRGEQTHAVATLTEELVGRLEHGDPGPLQASGVHRDAARPHVRLEPVVEPPHHDGADRAHGGCLPALALAPPYSPLHGFGDGDALGQREGDGGVDAHPAIGGLLDGRDPSARHRDLDDHVGRQGAEGHGIRHHGVGVAIETRVDLDRETPVAPLVSLEDRLEQLGRAHRHLLDQPPADGVLCGRRHLRHQGLDARPPGGQLLLQDRDCDHRVAGGSDRSIGDRVGELVNVRRVVPQLRRRGLSHLVESAFEGDRGACFGHRKNSL